MAGPPRRDGVEPALIVRSCSNPVIYKQSAKYLTESSALDCGVWWGRGSGKISSGHASPNISGDTAPW